MACTQYVKTNGELEVRIQPLTIWEKFLYPASATSHFFNNFYNITKAKGMDSLFADLSKLDTYLIFYNKWKSGDRKRQNALN